MLVKSAPLKNFNDLGKTKLQIGKTKKREKTRSFLIENIDKPKTCILFQSQIMKIRFGHREFWKLLHLKAVQC